MQVRFGAFMFDAATRELRCGDEPVHLPPRAFDLLALLLRYAPNAVSKTGIHRELWPETFVSDGNLAVLITQIRRAIGDSAREPLFIRTVNRFGYAFVGSLVTGSPSGLRASSPADCWLVRGVERFQLHAGENILGRDVSADIAIDAVGVSRRHAAIDVGDTVVTLRDLSSKNGTFVDGTRLIAPVTLHDNVEIRLGAVRLQFRRSMMTTATQTVDESEDVRGIS
jgi:DNA-binding winged helix-turn-helix (wHTH) protein